MRRMQWSDRAARGRVAWTPIGPGRAAAGVALILAGLAPAGALEAQPPSERGIAVQVEGLRAQELAHRAIADGWLGLRLSRTLMTGVNPAQGISIPPRHSVEVVEVVPGGPAEVAGIRVRDRLVRIAGKEAHVALEDGTVAGFSPGDRVEIVVDRDGATRALQVRVGRRPAVGFPPQATELARTRADSVRVVVSMQLDSIRSDLERVRFFVEGTEREAWVHEMRFHGLPPGAQVLVREGPGASPMIRSFVFVDSLRAQLPPGVEIVRGGISAGTGLRPAMAPPPPGGQVMVYAAGQRAVLGAEVVPVNPGLATYFGVDRGLLVADVVDGTPGARGGLRPGDVIVEAAGRPVHDVLALRREVERGFTQPAPLELVVVRERSRVTLRIPR